MTITTGMKIADVCDRLSKQLEVADESNLKLLFLVNIRGDPSD